MENAEAQPEAAENTANSGDYKNLESICGEQIQLEGTPANDYEAAANDHEGKSKGHKYESLDGALAIIHYTNPKTGETEYFLEQKAPNYGDDGKDPKIMKNRGRIGIFGGVVGDEIQGEKPLDAVAREIWEEIEDSRAASIIVNNLLDGIKFYDTFTEIVGGKIVRNFVYDANITSEKEWETITSSGAREGAIARKMTESQLLDLLQKGNKYFAYNHGEILLDKIMQNSTLRAGYSGGNKQKMNFKFPYAA